MPQKLKISRVTPVHKAGSKESLENYRPISGVPIFSKILENVVLIRLRSYIHSEGILSDSQYGFRENYSTTKALFNFIDEIYQAIDKREGVVGVFADLAKAFDVVCHQLLLKKLYNSGINSIPLSWFESYLEDRYQRVEVKYRGSIEASDWRKVHFGVPQGSMLGPMLFLLYINELPLSLYPSKCTLFADDTSFIIKETDCNALERTANSVLLNLQSWLDDNLLYINIKKTHCLQFRNSCSMSLNMGKEEVSSAFSTKLLGVIIDDKLSWHSHIEHLKNKVCSAIFAVRKLVNILDAGTIKIVYYAYVNSLLSYGIIFWGGSPDFMEIFKLQKWCIRVMTGIDRRTSCRQYFRELNILPLPSLYILEVLTFVKNNLHLFHSNAHFHEYPTRRRGDLCVARHRTALYERGPRYVGLKLYNMLPGEFKILSRVGFRAVLKRELQREAFYSINEYTEYYR